MQRFGVEEGLGLQNAVFFPGLRIGAIKISERNMEKIRSFGKSKGHFLRGLSC